LTIILGELPPTANVDRNPITAWSDEPRYWFQIYFP